MVNTRYGYLMNESPTFTHDIAQAMVTANFTRASNLAQRHMCTIWKREGRGKWEMYHQPSNKFDPESVKEILGGMFR